MQTIQDVLTALAKLSVDHLNGMIALGAIGLAAYAIYVISTMAREKRRR